MTKRKSAARKPSAKPATAAAPVTPERPAGGGSYRRDRATGKLELIEATEPVGVGTVEPDEVEDLDQDDADQGEGEGADDGDATAGAGEGDADPGTDNEIDGGVNDAAEQQEA